MSDEKGKIINFPKLNNAEVREYMVDFLENKSNESLTKLINKLVTLKVLVPAKIIEKDGKKYPMPLAIKDEKGNTFQPIFTGHDTVTKKSNLESVVLMDAIIIIDMVASQKGAVKGIVIDPDKYGIVLSDVLVEQIVKNEKSRINALKGIKDPNETARIKIEDMTEEQYASYQRTVFELNSFPGLFYENSVSVMDKISEGKENAIDEIYENAYADVRRYPYLTDEFNVMVMNIEDGEKIIYIKMPERDMNQGSLEGVYLVFDEVNNKSYYFGLMNRPQGTAYNKGIVYVANDKKILLLGEAPDEGNEVTFIREYIKSH